MSSSVNSSNYRPHQPITSSSASSASNSESISGVDQNSSPEKLKEDITLELNTYKEGLEDSYFGGDIKEKKMQVVEEFLAKVKNDKNLTLNEVEFFINANKSVIEDQLISGSLFGFKIKREDSGLKKVFHTISNLVKKHEQAQKNYLTQRQERIALAEAKEQEAQEAKNNIKKNTNELLYAADPGFYKRYSTAKYSPAEIKELLTQGADVFAVIPESGTRYYHWNSGKTALELFSQSKTHLDKAAVIFEHLENLDVDIIKKQYLIEKSFTEAANSVNYAFFDKFMDKVDTLPSAIISSAIYIFADYALKFANGNHAGSNYFLQTVKTLMKKIPRENFAKISNQAKPEEVTKLINLTNRILVEDNQSVATVLPNINFGLGAVYDTSELNKIVSNYADAPMVNNFDEALAALDAQGLFKP